MHWIFIAILTAFFFGTYNVFIKIASGHINQIVGAVILQVVAALLGGFLLLILKMNGSTLAISQKGIFYAVMAGLFVGLAEITSFFVFSRGIPASAGIPIIIGGSVLVAAIIGGVFLRESFGVFDYLGIAMIVGGIVILTAK